MVDDESVEGRAQRTLYPLSLFYNLYSLNDIVITFKQYQGMYLVLRLFTIYKRRKQNINIIPRPRLILYFVLFFTLIYINYKRKAEENNNNIFNFVHCLIEHL